MAVNKEKPETAQSDSGPEGADNDVQSDPAKVQTTRRRLVRRGRSHTERASHQLTSKHITT